MRTRLLMLGSLFGLFCSLPVITANASTDTMLQAAFIRNGDLWVKINGTERQITREKSVSSPRWSYDGKWIAYFVTADSEFNDKNTLRVRNVKTNQDTIVAVFQNHTCENIAWSPKSDVLAFQNGTILNDIAMNNIREQGFRNVSLGVAQFAWLPDGNGFLVSSSAQLLPDGWTRARLYAISLSPGKSLINTATPFYDLPKEVDVSGTKVLVIGTSTFKWSPDQKWIAFIVHPTASWSADSNVLCVLSSDTKRLIPVAEMLDRSDWFQWAPHSSELAFITGGGRFITENKHIGVASAPQFKLIDSFTPKGFVDNAFTWNDDTSLIVSRAKEGEYQAKLPALQLPSLYNVQWQNKVVRRDTSPHFNLGDYQPMWHQKSQSLIWVRSSDRYSSIWLTDKDASRQIPWITNISREEWTPYWSMWNKLIDIR